MAAAAVLSLHGIAIRASRSPSSALPICPCPPFSYRSFSASLKSYFAAQQHRHGLIPLNFCKFPRTACYGDFDDMTVKDPPCIIRHRPKVSIGYEFARYAAPKATSLVTYELSGGETDGVGRCKHFLIINILRSLQFRSQWVRAVTVVGILTLGGVLAWRSRAYFAVYFCFGIALWLVGHGDFKSAYAKAVQRLESFVRATTKFAHSSHVIVASDIALTIARKARGNNVANRLVGEDPMFSTSQGSRAPTRSDSGDLIETSIYDAEIALMNVAELLRSIISSKAVSVDTQSLDRIMSTVVELRRDLQAMEVALSGKESVLNHSKLNKKTGIEKVAKTSIKGLPTMKISDSDIAGESTASRLIKYVTPVVIARHTESTSLPVFDNSKPVELQQKSQLISVQNVPGEEARAAHPVKLQNNSLRNNAVEMTGRKNSTLTGLGTRSYADDDLVEVCILSNSSLVEKQKPRPLPDQYSTKTGKQEQMEQWINSSSWDTRGNFWAHPAEPKVLAGDDWAVTSKEKPRNPDSQSVDLVLVGSQNSHLTPQDRATNGREVNAYNRVEFWGKNAVGITKMEQRGSLTSRKATGRGNFVSADDAEDDRPLAGATRSDEEQNNFLRRDRPSTPRQPWDGRQPGASGREAERDYRELSLDGFAPGSAEPRPQDTQRLRDLDKRINVTDGERSLERLGSIWSKFGPEERSSFTSVLDRPRVEGERTKQPIYETSSSRQSKDVNKEESSRPIRTWDVPFNSDGMPDRGLEVGPRAQRNPYTLTPNQLEIKNRKLTSQQLKDRSQKFQNNLDEGEALLEQGMQALDGKIEVGVAERMLYEGEKLFESAAEMDPANLTAVGLCGNTLLVHGHLKLKLSQELRRMLSPLKKYSFSTGRMRYNERESLELTLQDVCEECEDLLMDAGRKYRRALSLDRNDFRSLYNWGLALCYRGQLISEEDGEKAMQDADKVYLAAIDKFETMLGMSKSYSVGALLNWGQAMRDRSRLRAMGDKERVQLLLQARELFMDAVRLHPTYEQARAAVAACAAELAELEDFESLRQTAAKKGGRLLAIGGK